MFCCPQSGKYGSFAFTLGNRLLKLCALGLRGNNSLMTTRLVASRLRFASWLILLGALCFTAFAFAKRCHYAGKPFEDSMYHRGPQHIPGRVMCAYYDLGGEGARIMTPMRKTTAVGRSIRRTGPI